MEVPFSYAHVVSGPVNAIPPVPPVALCFGCLHSFPTDTRAAPSSHAAVAAYDPTESASAMLRESPFGDSLRRCLHQLRTHAARVEPLTDRSRESIAGLEDELKRLVVIVDQELTARQKHVDKLAVQLKYYSEWEAQIQRQLRNVLEQQAAQQKLNASQQAALNSARAASHSSRYGANSNSSKLLERFIASARAAAPDVRPSSAASGTALVTNRYGAAVSRIPRRPDSMSAAEASQAAAALPSMSSSARKGGYGGSALGSGRGKSSSMDDHTLQVFQQISAAVYQVLEALAVTTRAAIGTLWLGTDEAGDELTAPFLVVGRNDGFARKDVGGEGSNNICISAASSTAGAVASTGIAVSIRRPQGNGAEESLQQALVATVRSTLIVPVFRKFHAAERVCDGALQLIAWANGAAFTPDDEFAAVAAANVISHMISNYSKAFRQHWSTRPPFDPALLRRYASFNAALDQAQGNIRDAVTTASAVGHSGGGGTLIHRCDFGHAPVGSTKAIMRQELRAAGQSPTQSALVAPKDAVRDLQRYTHTLESSWKSAVLSLGDSEKRVTELQRQLDLAKQHGIIEGHRPRTVASAAPSTQAASMSPARVGSADDAHHHQPMKSSSSPPRLIGRRKSSTGPGHSSLPGAAASMMTNQKLDDLEADTRNRMRSAAAVKTAHGKSTVFLTE